MLGFGSFLKMYEIADKIKLFTKKWCEKTLFFTCLASLALHTSHAQYNETLLLSNLKGLNSNEVSNVFVDSKNGVWISSFSTTGISFYNGQKISFLKTLAGKSSSGHNNAIEDRYGSLWVAREGVGLTQFRNGKITDYLLPNLSTALLDWYTKDILALEQNGSVFSFDAKTQKFKKIFAVPFVNETYKLYKVMAKLDGTYYFQLNNENGSISDLVMYKNQKFELLPRITQKNNIRPARILNGKQLVCVLNNRLYALSDDNTSWNLLKTPFLPDEQLNILGSRQDKMFVAHRPKPDVYDIYQLLPLSNQWVKRIGFKCKFMLYAVSQDQQGNYWFASSGGALKVYNNFLNYDVNDYSQLADLTTICQTPNGNLWIVSETNGISYLQNDKIVSALPNQKILMGSMALTDNSMIFNEANGKNIQTDGKQIKRIYPNCRINKWAVLPNKNMMCVTPNNGIFLGKGVGFVNDSLVRLNINQEKGLQFGGATDATQDGQGNIWLGKYSNGVAVYSPKADTTKTWNRTNEATDFGAGAFATDYMGNIWLGTNKGLYFYETKKLSAKTEIFRDAKPIASALLADYQVVSLRTLNQRYLVIGTKGGLAVLDIQTFYKSKFEQTPILFYNKSNGFSGEMCINQGIISDKTQPNTLWIAHEQGLTKMGFNPNGFTQKAACLRIDSIFAGKKSLLIQKNHSYVGNPGVSSLKIYFSDTLTRYNTGETSYKYRILSNREPSSLSEPFYNTQIDLPYLQAGKYTLQILATKNGIVSPSFNMEIEIQDFWFKQLWFLLLLLVILGVLAHSGISRNYKIRLQQRENDHLQTQAIASQFNPHFVNNALQWLQAKVVNDKDAVRFIAKLAENIRIVFINTRKKQTHHSIAEEMMLLENYFIMQKYRFGDRLSYTMPPPDEIEQYADYQIPLMQLQIHCENSVEHGIRNQELGGEINICFLEDAHYICIEIQDTGIGRKKAAEIGSRNQQQGTLMLKQLHEILNASSANKNNQKIYSFYTDNIFYTEKYEPFGTKLTIKIPKIFSYELN